MTTNYSQWLTGLTGLSESAGSRPLGRPWSPYAEANTGDAVLHIFYEVVHRGAEIGPLRDLYTQRANWSAQ